MSTLKNFLLSVFFGLVFFGCQSTRVIYPQQVGPNEKDEFAVLASFSEVYYFTLDCQDTNCQMRRCTDSTYSECPTLLAECKNDELELMLFKNDQGLSSETRICKNYKKKFLADLQLLGLTRYAKLMIKSSFEGSIAKDDFRKALNDGYKIDLRIAKEPRLIVEENLDIAKCTYTGPSAAALNFELDVDSKMIRLTGPQNRSFEGVTCIVPYTGKPVPLI
jgi:hypothetical protein